jgi:hypothetical protein
MRGPQPSREAGALVSNRGAYRGCFTSLVDDPDYQLLKPNARLVLLTLRLSPACGPAAIFRSYPAVVAEQSGLDLDAVELAEKELETSPDAERPWILRQGGIVWIRNALRYDPNIRLADPKHRIAIERAVAGLPRLEIVARFCDYYGIARPFVDPPKGLGRPSEDLSPPSTTPRTITEDDSERGFRPLGSPSGNGSHARIHRVDLRESS